MNTATWYFHESDSDDTKRYCISCNVHTDSVKDWFLIHVCFQVKENLKEVAECTERLQAEIINALNGNGERPREPLQVIGTTAEVNDSRSASL